MRQLGDLLVERGLLAPQDYAVARAVRAETGANAIATLLRMGALSEDAVLAVLSEQIGLSVMQPDAAPGVDAVRRAIDELGGDQSWFIANEVLIWRDGDGALNAAGPRLHEAPIQEAIEQWPHRVARQFLAPASIVEPILVTLGGRQARLSAGLDTTRLLELAEEAPVVDFVNSIFAEALAARASDVHFEPFEDLVAVRLRIDGVLAQRRTTTRDMYDAISSRLKLLSGMDIAERRLPQDGRQSIRVAGRDVDVRVSSLPTTWGESIVVRLLGDTRRIPELSELGLTDAQRAMMSDVLKLPNGLVLVTGPTGSGKTTSVYRLLSLLNDGVRKIVTIEDPVEFDLPGVLQMTVRADIDLDFAAGLRSILRQDPDVIFVGEIRDAETARTAVQAALTGHLVISTVHTNSAIAAVARMVDLGVERFLLADVLRALVGQRLVRCLCEACATPASPPQAPEASGTPRWRASHGCKACAGAGFVGRMGVFETARVGAALQDAIRAGASEGELIAIARTEGFTTLLENGLNLARAGRTTYSEALRVLGQAP